MKFMLMMHAPRAGWKNAGIGTWPPADIQAHIAFMMRFHDELKQSGELVDAQGLAGPEEALVVRADAGGAPVVTDGPFAEAKEFLAGFGSSMSKPRPRPTPSRRGRRRPPARAGCRSTCRSRCAR